VRATVTQAEWVKRLDELHLLTPLRIVIVLIVAFLLTLAVNKIVRRMLRKTFSLPGLDRTRAEARQQALSTATRSAVVGLIWASAVITVVSEVGINIGAFVATATIIGGAIGFGAQQLVRDLLAGMFVLAEDQYGVGDQVDLGHAVGTVERISLRSVRVRDGMGGVWYVPHGGVARVGNMSKESVAVLDLEVARSTTLDVLNTQAAALCEALAADAEASAMLAGPPEVVGVVKVTDDRLVCRMSVATLAGKQDGVRSRWRLLALRAFEAGTLTAPALAAPVVNLHTIAAPTEE
jgi:small-conductance mechanosensitive channel